MLWEFRGREMTPGQGREHCKWQYFGNFGGRETPPGQGREQYKERSFGYFFDGRPHLGRGGIIADSNTLVTSRAPDGSIQSANRQISPIGQSANQADRQIGKRIQSANWPISQLKPVREQLSASSFQYQTCTGACSQRTA